MDEGQGHLGCGGAFQDKVDLRACHPRWAIETHSVVVIVPAVVRNSERVGGNGLVALAAESKERHGVAVSAHCEVGGKFVQVVAKGQMVKEEMCVWS